MVELRSSHPQLLWPGVKATFGATYKEIKPQWTKLFDKRTSDKSEEKVVELTGYGLAPIKSEASGISYDTSREGITQRFVNITYGLGAIVSMEATQDGQYKELGPQRAKGLAFSHRQTEEVVHANHFARAFNASYLGGDGATLCSVSHPTRAGNQANRPATDADLSEAAIEDMCIDIMNCKNSRGLRIDISPKRIIVPPDLHFDARRVVESRQRSGTANNDKNILNDYLDEVFTYRYLDADADAWGIQTDCPEGFLHFDRMETELEKDNEFNTKNALMSVICRYISGYGDWRCYFGTQGA